MGHSTAVLRINSAGSYSTFDGKLKLSKWAKITKCSPDTALRDIKDLINKAILKQDKSGGRSTNYELNEF